MLLAEERDQPGSFVAIKCINKKSIKGKEESLENEIDVLRRSPSHTLLLKAIRFANRSVIPNYSIPYTTVHM